MKKVTTLLLAGIILMLIAPNYCTAAVTDTSANNMVFSVSKVLGDNMVVQRGKPFTVWGQAPAGDRVEVKVSWNSRAFTVLAGAKGDWEVAIPAAAANSSPQTIIANDTKNGATNTISNILIGDVWLCSGQSNMDMVVDSTSSWPGSPGITNYKAEIAAANYPGIRLSKTPYGRPDAPAHYLEHNAPWKICTPADAGNFSAIAYLFGRRLHKELNVPIGLVVSSLGATSGEEWTAGQVIANDTALKAFYTDKNISKLYNGMIYPLKKLAIKGFLWD
ncbi:MAG: hypothetical protein ABIN95_12710, partial [Mucilaginibacter sp.]